jgi:hypothetical protein
MVVAANVEVGRTDETPVARAASPLPADELPHAVASNAVARKAISLRMVPIVDDIRARRPEP